MAAAAALAAEQVNVEQLAIGDFVVVEPRAGTRTECLRVLALKAIRHGETSCLIGWVGTVAGRRQRWLRRGERIARRSARVEDR